MSLKDKIGKCRVETRELAGLGAVSVRCLSARQMLAIGELPQGERAAELVAASVLDEAGEPLFACAHDAGEIEWTIFRAMLEAVNQVNALDVEEAEKK